MNPKKIAVIGGGASGMFAAGHAAKLGALPCLKEIRFSVKNSGLRERDVAT